MAGDSVRTVEALLLEFLGDDTALHAKAFAVKGRREHTVAFEVEKRLDVVRRRYSVKISKVIGGPGIGASAGGSERAVIIGDMYRRAEHQMLKQVRNAGLLRSFITSADAIKHIEAHHSGGLVTTVYYAQPVGKGMHRRVFAYCEVRGGVISRVGRADVSVATRRHFLSMMDIEIIRMSLTGRSPASVCAFSIFSTTSIPLTTSPKTV